MEIQENKIFRGVTLTKIVAKYKFVQLKTIQNFRGVIMTKIVAKYKGFDIAVDKM
jgi:hypothetical protein